MTDENNQPQSGGDAGEGLLDNVSIDNPQDNSQENPQKA